MLELCTSCFLVPGLVFVIVLKAPKKLNRRDYTWTESHLIEPLQEDVKPADHALCFICTQGLLVDQQNMLKELPCENKVSSSSSEATLTPGVSLRGKDDILIC